MISTVKIEEAEKRVSARGLYNRATEFHDAAQMLIRIQSLEKLRMYNTACFLASHAIELYLKSFHRAKQKSLKELYNYGHDLERSYHDAFAIGLLPLSDNLEKALIILSSYHNSREENLRYFISGSKTYPKFTDVYEMLDEMQSRMEFYEA